jgi:hypothetical protein
MMTCSDAMERVSEALAGGPPQDESLARHLEGCLSCRQEARRLELTWHRLGELSEPEPSPALRRRFEAALAEEISRQEAAAGHPTGASWRGRLAASWSRAAGGPAPAWVAAALVAGLGVGALLGTQRPDPRVEALQGQVGALHEMVALSLLEQESPSRRLQGVQHGVSLGSPPPPLEEALVRAVDWDPNVNVRLAALDALAPVAGEGRVLNRLLRSFPDQESPLVQIEMIDLLLAADGAEARRVVAQLAEDPELPVEVRRHILARLGRET